ncbi:FERM and PDZ domain-containing protein 2 [Alosa pseudoharengus]|uniref:FERM and PDZ domain-containing protein 2 n=1 Tax=Alosa pseudoharengus TaxID=34774 RepID=UPI003F8C149F
MSSTFVTLAEVLEARGSPLGEDEVWSLLLGTAEALVDLSYKGQTNICNIITPGSLLLSATGTLAFKSCIQSEETSPFTAPEMLQGRPISTKLAMEKVAVYSLGMTLYWCVDYRLPQNQPVQLSDALNVLLLSMCEDVAHRRRSLSSILESCEEQQKAAPLPPPNRVIRQLVEHLLNNTADNSTISDPVVPLSGRSQMVRERLHGKRSAYFGYPEGNGASGQRRRLSSDSELHKGGSSQQKQWAQKRRSSPPQSFQTLPNRLQRGLQQRGSSSSSWLSRSPYLSDAGPPLSPPISLSDSSASLTQRKAKTLGPEFVRMGDEPPITLELPGSIVSKKGKSCASQREVSVFLPNDQCLLVRCDIQSRGRDVFDMVVAHANLVEHFYFGLAFIDDDEFFFLEPELKISKVAPDVWKKQPGCSFTLYLRVKFFVDDVSFIQHRLTRHQFYLQLRKDLVEDRLHCNEDTALYLAALALQAEFGDYMHEVYGRTYFQLEQYVSKRVVEKMALPCVREELPRLHANNTHMLPEEAEMEFLKLMQQLPEYGVLFHRVGRERDKRPIGSDLLLGVSSKGVSVYELRNNNRYMSRCFHWSETDSISTGRHKLTIECGPSGKKHSFQTESSRIAQYLLNLCSAQHKFHSEMTSRQLTHTLTTDENLEKYLAVCRSQHAQMKRLSCSEIVLNNVGLSAALPSDSISKSCDDLSAKVEARQRKQRELQDICEMREPLLSNRVSTPEPIHRIMSSMSLQKQDSEVYSGSSSIRDTPTRTPPEREIICVTLKKDPTLGYGFVIVGEDNTGKLDLGIFIATIVPDGPADKDGRIRAGGRLISLNKISLEGVSFTAAAAILQNSPEEVELIVSQPNQNLQESKPSQMGGAGGYGLMLERSYDSQTTLSSEYRPAVEELEEALTTLLTPKAGRRLNVPVVRILDTQDNWSRCSSMSSLRGPETLFVELRKINGSLGISVAGGVNTSVHNGGIYIKSLVMGGAADLDGKIQIGDRLVEVDGTNLRRVTHRQAVECLKRTGEVVTLLLEREQQVVLDTSTPSSTLERQVSPSLSNSSSASFRRDVTMETTSSVRPKDYNFVSDESTLEVSLRRSVSGLGFSFMVCDVSSPPGRAGGSVVRIKRLFPGQPADESGLLRAGDVILAVNGQSLKGVPYQKVLLMLRGAADEVRLTICRPPPGVLPDMDTYSLSPGPSPMREMRSMSLDLRMRDLSMDFHRLLQLKAKEQHQDKVWLLQRLERLEEKERTAHVEHEEAEGDADESPPSTPSPPTSSSGSEPGDTPTRALNIPLSTPLKQGLPIGSLKRDAGPSSTPTKQELPIGSPKREVEPSGSPTHEAQTVTESAVKAAAAAAASAVTMATDSSLSQEDAVRSSLKKQNESTTFPSGVRQQVNGSTTFCMVSNGLAFLADEDPNKLSWTDEEEEEEDPNRVMLKEFELTVTLTKSWSGSFGFTITRSKLDGCYYIQEVLDNPARSDGRLRAGDRLIIVNGHNVTSVTDDMAMSILRSSSRKLVMVIGRAVQNLVAPPSADSLPDITLHKTLSGQLGIKLTGGIGSRWQGIYVLEVVPSSPASEEGSLQPQDKILYISGRCTLGMTLEDAVKACENATRKVKLKALREDQPVTPKAKWNGLFDWKKERRFFPRFEEPYSPEPEHFTEEGTVSVRVCVCVAMFTEEGTSCILQVEFSKPEGSGLGFALMGGANGSALRVKEICCGGAAQQDGRLRVGDILLEVNGVIVSGLSHSKVVDILRTAEGVVQLTVCRDFLSMAPPTEQCHAPPPTTTEDMGMSRLHWQIRKRIDPPEMSPIYSQEDNSSTPPPQSCCPSVRDLLPDSPKELPSAWSSEEEEEEEEEEGFVQPSTFNILPPTGRPIVSEEELSSLAIISPSNTGCYSGSRVKTLIQILQHQDQQELIKEFLALEHMKPSDNCLVGKAPENRQKNRYRDILPYDKTRVPLGKQQEYINASYIRMQVGLEEFFYISCQAPLPSTVEAFWQMIWENRSDVIAMATQEVERGRVKCHKYWPDRLDVPMETDRYQLILDNYQQLDFFHINIIKMVEKESGSCHWVKQLCVRRWPDHGPPGSSEQLVRFLRYMRAVHSRGPITVHCSAGIGRTGVLICTDAIISLIQNDLAISVSDIVKDMRTQRYGMIQTKEQYLFCYKVWLDVLQGVLQLHGNQWQPEASV